jgi:hypothetical protein
MTNQPDGENHAKNVSKNKKWEFHMKFFSKKETARQAHIRILRMIDDKIDEHPKEYRDTVLTADLITAGHLKGVARVNNVGMPLDNAVTGMGVSGRLFLDQIEKAEKDGSFLGSLKRAGALIVGFLLGIAGTVAGAVILHLLKL